MTVYWCRFLDLSRRVFGAEKIEAADDESVKAKARTIFAMGIIGGFEIWDGNRLVDRYHRGSLSPDAAPERPASLGHTAP